MGNRSKQGVSHALGFGCGSRVDHVARQRRALQCRRNLFGERVKKRARFRVEHTIAVPRHPDNSDAPALSSNRNEEPWGSGRNSRPCARRFVARECPLRCAHALRIERVFRRPGPGQQKCALMAQENDGRPPQARMDFAGRPIGDGIDRCEPRKFAGEFIETPHRPHAIGRDTRLVADASRQRRRYHGDDEEDDKRQKFVGLGDREGVKRLDEKEVVGKER